MDHEEVDAQELKRRAEDLQNTRSMLECIFSDMIALEASMQMSLVEKALSLFKEEVSDLIGAQLDALKVGEVADAVKAAVADAKRVANMDTISMVREQFSVGDLQEKMLSLPDEIFSQRIKINTMSTELKNLRQQLDGARDGLKDAENMLLMIIAGETVTDGGKEKPVYSNDKARLAELAERKKTDPFYMTAEETFQNLRNMISVRESDVSRESAELDRLSHRFAAMQKKLEFMGQEMALAAAVIASGGDLPDISQISTNEPRSMRRPTGNKTINESQGGW